MTKAIIEFERLLKDDGYTVERIGEASSFGAKVNVYRAVKYSAMSRCCEILFWADFDPYNETFFNDYISVSVDPTGYGRFVRRYNWYHQTAEVHFKALRNVLQGKGLRVG